jgi:hypothetical protein
MNKRADITWKLLAAGSIVTAAINIALGVNDLTPAIFLVGAWVVWALGEKPTVNVEMTLTLGMGGDDGDDDDEPVVPKPDLPVVRKPVKDPVP